MAGNGFSEPVSVLPSDTSASRRFAMGCNRPGFRPDGLELRSVTSPSSALRAVYKGSTPDAQGLHNLLKRGHPLSFLCAPLVHGVRMALASGPFHKCMHVSAARHSGGPEPAVALPDISIVPPESLHYLSVVSPSHLCKLCRGATVRLWRGNGGLRVRLRGRTREWAVGSWRGRRWQWSIVWK